MAMVRCGECRQEKSDTEFYRRRRMNKNGTLYVHTQQPCKACKLEYMRQQHPLRRLIVPDGYKNCPHCRRVLVVEEFDKNAGRHDGRQVYCRKCWPLYVKYRNRRPEVGFLMTASAKRAYMTPAGN